MRKYLICYWAERNDCATDLENIVEADNITEALKKFKTNNVFKSIDSISEIINPNYTPNFNYENN
jgi:recombination DNA repair RAD52 pathway protein